MKPDSRRAHRETQRFCTRRNVFAAEIEDFIENNDDKTEPPTCQSLSPVYPPPHGGAEDDDRGSNDQTVGGGEAEVLPPQLQHVAAASEPPHVVPPGGEGVGPVHSPRHPSLNLHTAQSGRDMRQSKLTKPQVPCFIAI